jgi:hypothetical protein
MVWSSPRCPGHGMVLGSLAALKTLSHGWPAIPGHCDGGIAADCLAAVTAVITQVVAQRAGQIDRSEELGRAGGR